MKFVAIFKTPDVLQHSTEDMTEEQREQSIECMERFVRFGEYIKIEFDTETNTAKVLGRLSV